MSQCMTFLYSPQLGSRSSRPVTKQTAVISKAWQPGRTPNLDRTIGLLRMQVDTVSYLHACVVRPPKWPYIRRHIGLSQESEFGSQSALTHESITTLDLAETSALDCAWRVVPFKDESAFVLVAYFISCKEPGETDFACTVIIAIATVTFRLH